jgi:hypothetical protein
MTVVNIGKGIAVVVFLAVHLTNAAQLLVSKPGGLGAYNTIMAAVKAAKPKDSVVITDEGVYEEQVTIDSTKSGLVLCSSNPTSMRKPTIKWQDKVNVGPTTCAESKIEEKITFDQNGALQVKRVRGVIIDGIAIDGGGAFPFGKDGIWSTDSNCTKGGCQGSPCPLQHGNAALTLWITGDAIIRNCDITNAYFGINVKDRNEGGINANPNPSDIDKSRVVALSGFGKTGNHVFEHNRIHDNSVGMFFESTWDLGSVIRYNLFYENHHATTALATKVKGLTGDGGNHAGGALMFKDHLFSPLAIYNNTFWHNYLIFIGLWRPGSQFTIFNNIYAEPYMFWSLETVFTGGGSTAIDGIFVNRMHNCVYACQQQAPQKRTQPVQARDTATNEQVVKQVTVYEPRIMNNVGDIEAVNLRVPIELSYGTVTEILQNAKVQGNRLISTGTGANARGFPASADIRWLETKFKSTDPKSADFLVPDWSDSLVNQYVKDKGWEAAGILDNDGSRADLGAIPSSGKIDNLVKITPNMPVLISPDKPTQAMVSFIIDVQKGTFKDPVIKYLKWIDNIPIDTNSFGDNRKKIESASIIDVTIPTKKLKVGTNDSIIITIPAQDKGKMYAFFELVIEGTDDQGNKVQSAMGFLSYRQLDYMFKVIVMSPDYKDTLNEVTVGQPYGLRLVPMKIGGTTTAFSFKVDTVEVALRSNFTLLNPNGDTAKINGGIPKDAGKVDESVVFMHIPENGFEAVIARGEFTNSSQAIRYAIWGVSKDIKVNPGVAENIVFIAPGSKTNNIIDPGQKYDVKLQLTDKFGNKVKQATAVSLKSLKTEFGNVIGSGDTLSDANGIASFNVEVTNGDLYDTFPIVGTLKLNGKADTTFMIVGKARPRMFIFYSDTAKYDPTVEIPPTTCSGTRVKVQVRATTKGTDTLTDINNAFGIEFSSDILAAYADENSDQKITSAKLDKGIASFWIQATKGSIRDGKIMVFNKDSIKIYDGSRAGINFSQCVTNISSADYHADNGYGRVDRLDLFYPKKLKATEVPDSLMLYWPTSGENKKIVKRESMALDSLDSSHIIVRLPDPFPEGITFTSQKQLGTSYWKNPVLTDVITYNFNINEKVGSLITSAELIERLVVGAPDTMNISFSEFVQAQLVSGDAFTLIRGGIPLNIIRAEQVSSTTLKVVVKNTGEEVCPKAGDSIKILVSSNGTSLVVDGENNSAHPANRPVVITLKEIAPAIDSAYYKDENADGTIDKVIIAFNKKVKISNLSYVVDFRGVFTDTLHNDRATYYQNDTMKIALDLNKAIKSGVIGFTDGTMNVVVLDSQFKGTLITKPAADRAAPVVKTADYYQGRLTEDKTQLPDTLKIQFSENIKNDELKSGDPFEFLQTSKGNLYYVSLVKISLVNNLYMFRVVPLSKEMLTQNVQWASTGDSVRIHTDGATGPFADIQNNYQLNQSNIRVKMVVHEVPVDLDIRMGPNPFIPGNGSYVKIMVKPEVLRQQDVNVQTTVTILDNLGSMVFSSVDSVKDDITLEIKWDGTNRNGRYVGTGTYAVYIKAIDLTKNNRKIAPALKKLAVDRQYR